MRRQRTVLCRAAVLAVLTVAVAAVGCGNDSATVPDVIGLQPDQAVQRICEAGLRPGQLTQLKDGPPLTEPTQFHIAMRASKVVATRPSPGTKIDPGSAVDMTYRIPKNAELGVLISNTCGSAPPS